MNNSKQVAIYDSDGWFAGFDSDYGGPLPHSATYILPDLIEDFIPRWTGEGWEQIENHKGKKGYVNGQYTTIAEYGPRPEGWSDEYIDPRTPEEIRTAEIDSELRVLDDNAARPLCTVISKIAAGAAIDSSDEDAALLLHIESIKEALREERRALVQE